jgi:protein-S-isoprenylcysteine O-methyltransferase Ste14
MRAIIPAVHVSSTVPTRGGRAFAWAGAAAFGASLAYFLFTYAVTFGETAPAGPAGAAVAWDVGLFTAFALHHTVFARERFRAAVARSAGPDLERPVYVWIASVLLLLVLAFWQPVPGDVYDIQGWRAVGHGLLQLGGVWLIARSVARIDALELAGIKPESERGPLQIRGPYRWVRHPLYLGWVIAAFGTPHMTGNRLAFAAITSAYLVLAIPWEERSLLRAFGDAYSDYRRRVRWRLLPFIY